MSLSSGASATTTRRELLRTAALLAPAAGLLSACSAGGDEKPLPAAGPLGNGGPPDNPFNVDGTMPLDVLIFNGGYSDRYAVDGHERMYRDRFPDAAISHVAVKQISQILDPLLTVGKPPDVVNNGGANAVPEDALYATGRLTDLNLLLDAPSFDDPAVKVRDTLRPGIVAAGSFGGGNMYTLQYAYTVYGLWYNAALFADRGWAVPATWDELTALAAEIKSQGIAPLIFQGRFPYYLVEPFLTLAVRHGGADVAKSIDNLDAGAWRQESVRAAAEAWYRLGAAGFVHPEAGELTHTESQGLWNIDDAAFIPCGSWLENEQRESTPEGFETAVIGPPPLAGSVAPTMLNAGGAESFIVPTQARNAAGALEYLRIMLSKAGSRQFSDRVASLTCVKDSGEGLRDPGIRSTVELLEKTGDDTYVYYLEKWYKGFVDDAVGPALRRLFTGALTPDAFMNTLQEATDALREDDAVPKFHRD